MSVLLSFTNMYAQIYINLNVNAPSPLIANAGGDKTIQKGNNVQIGAETAATGGTPLYTYLWQPNEGLNNVNIANPIANPILTTTYTLIVTDANNCISSDTIVIKVDTEETYIAEQSYSSNINIYPNPNTGKFYIKINNLNIGDKIELVIFNSLLQNVYNEKINTFNSNIEKEIQMTQLNKGIYIVKINSTQGSVVRKLIIN